MSCLNPFSSCVVSNPSSFINNEASIGSNNKVGLVNNDIEVETCIGCFPIIKKHQRDKPKLTIDGVTHWSAIDSFKALKYKHMDEVLYGKHTKKRSNCLFISKAVAPTEDIKELQYKYAKLIIEPIIVNIHNLLCEAKVLNNKNNIQKLYAMHVLKFNLYSKQAAKFDERLMQCHILFTIINTMPAEFIEQTGITKEILLHALMFSTTFIICGMNISDIKDSAVIKILAANIEDEEVDKNNIKLPEFTGSTSSLTRSTSCASSSDGIDYECLHQQAQSMTNDKIDVLSTDNAQDMVDNPAPILKETSNKAVLWINGKFNNIASASVDHTKTNSKHNKHNISVDKLYTIMYDSVNTSHIYKKIPILKPISQQQK